MMTETSWQLYSTPCIFNVEISVLNLYMKDQINISYRKEKIGKGTIIAALVNGKGFKWFDVCDVIWKVTKEREGLDLNGQLARLTEERQRGEREGEES